MNLNQYDRGDNGGRQKDRGGKDDFAGWVVIMARNLARGRWLVNSFEADVPGSLTFLRPVELSQGLICAHCLDSRSLRAAQEKRSQSKCWSPAINKWVAILADPPSPAWEWNVWGKKGGGDICSGKKRGRGALSSKKVEDNAFQWHHGMVGRGNSAMHHHSHH